MASLDGINLKLSRAQEHLDALDAEVRGYIESRPYREVREYDPETHSRAVGLRIVESPRPEWSVRAGDCLYNLRSALDHIAWQLVLANNAQPTRKTEFPIFEHSHVYKNRVAGKTAGIHPMAVAVIEALQPYHRRKQALTHPLQVLHDLNRIDKHQTLLLVGAWLPDAAEFHVNLPGHTNAQVFFFELTTRPPQDQVDMYAQSVLQVALEEPTHLRGRPIVGLLREAVEFIRHDLLPRFKPFLN